MGIFNFFGAKEQKEEKNDYGELSQSIIFEIAKMKQKIMAMTIYYPEKAQDIQNEIYELEEYIENSVGIETEEENYIINSKYQKIKKDFESFKKVSEEKFLLGEVSRIQKELDTIFFGEEDSENEVSVDQVLKLGKALELLDKNKTQFTGLKQHQYIKAIIEARYRLRCCNMIMESADRIINYFAEAPEVERVFYANLFIQDIQTMYEKINHIQVRYKLEGLEISLEEQEKALDLLIDPITNQYTEEKERLLTDIFQDDGVMKNYIQVAQELRQKVSYLQKGIEQEKEREKYKTLSEEEQRKKIKELDDTKFDITQSYKDIIQYEKEVAKAKGLLNEKEGMATEDMEFVRVKTSEIYEYLLSAREKRIKISVLPDVDEQRESTLVMVPKGVKIERLPLQLGKEEIWFEKSECIYSRSIAYLIQNHYLNKDKGIMFGQTEEGFYPYVNSANNGWKNYDCERLERILDDIRERIAEENEKGMEETKFYIQIPYLRPMVPILEQLREQEIEYYIPPIDEKTHKYEPTKKIYMDRENLPKYKAKVHNEISNIAKGVITIGTEEMRIGELLFEERETEQR